MHLGSTLILDTYAEAFRMRFARIVVTALDDYWLGVALAELCGMGTSVLGCDAEIGVERRLAPDETPDGRPGAAVLAFAFSTEDLSHAVPNRVGQCVLTCPTTAAFDGLPGAEESIQLGKWLRFFGDGFQKSQLAGERKFWHIPVMDGEFVVEEMAGVGKGVAGGNIILQGETQQTALAAALRAAQSVSALPEVITPFPSGVVRSGSKVGSKYEKLRASTNDAFCPTLRDRTQTQLVDGAQCAYEIVIDGMTESAVRAAMTAAIRAAAGEGVLAIGAGNYGGKLGKFQFRLHDLLAPPE